MLINWTPVAFEKGFLEDENGKFIPRNTILEALESAAIFYYTKKDKEIEKLIKKYLTGKPKLKEISKEVKRIVFSKYPILEKIEIPEKLYVKNTKTELVKVFDLEKKEFIKSLKIEVSKDIVDEVTVKSDNLEKIKNACKAYSRALAEYEHKALKGTDLEELVADIQNKIANEWEIPVRIGYWTLTPFKGDLLFFWRDKEVREFLLKNLKVDIRPKNVLFSFNENEFLGWSEIHKND